MRQLDFFPALRRIHRNSSPPPFRLELDYFDLAALTFAQRALAAREIFLRAAALIFRRLRTAFPIDDGEALAAKASSRDCRRSIRAFKTAMRFSLATERLRSPFMFIVKPF